MSSARSGDIMTNAEAYSLLKDVNEEQLFYASKQHGKFLDLLTHLSRYSNLLLTLVGPSGSGKTHIKNRFLANLDSGVVVCKMHGENVADIKDLSARIAQAFNLDNHVLSTVNTLVGELRQNIESFSEDGKSCLILIDNAEKLSDASLQMLLELANTIEDSQRPHIVLFGRPELAERLKSSPHYSLFEPVGHLLELNNFSEEETASYIDYRLKSVGINVFPFNDNDFSEIYQASGGWPGNINKILLDYFKNNKGNKVLPNNRLTSIKRDAKKRDNKNNKTNTSYLFPLISAIIFILLAALMFFFNASQKQSNSDQVQVEKREATVLGKRIKSASSDSSLEELDINRKSSNISDMKEHSGIVQTGKQNSVFNKLNSPQPAIEKPNMTDPVIDKPKMDDIKFNNPEVNPQESNKMSSEQSDNNNHQDEDKQQNNNSAIADNSDNSSNDIDPAFKQIEPNVATESKVIDLSAIEPEPVVEEVAPKNITSDANQPAPTPESNNSVARVEPDKNSTASKPAKVVNKADTKPVKPKVPATIKNVETTVSKAKNPYKKEDFLLKQPRYKYTLQFFGSHSENNVIGFIKNQPYKYRKDFVYYEVKLNNRPWFVAVMGVYSNRTEAVKAIEKLPMALKRMQPWAHSFGGIQDDIKDR